MLQMTYARFFPSDWRSGCLTLSLEEEGLYIRCCAFMYDTGQPIPGNDNVAARLLNVQILKYKKVMASLIAKGKMIRAQGSIINERVLEEMDRYRREQAKRSEAAKKREERRRQQLQDEITEALKGKKNGKDTPQDTPHHTHQITPLDNPGVSTTAPPTVDSEKTNKINDTRTEPCHSGGTKPESRSQKPDILDTSSNEEVVADATPDSEVERSQSVQALEAFRAYNDLAQRIGLPIAKTLTPQRRKNLCARLREHGGIEAWQQALANVERSAFLRGNNARGWRLDFDFLVTASKFAKVFDGVYGNGAHAESEPVVESKAERFSRLLNEIDLGERRV